MSAPRPLPLRANLEWLKKLSKDRLAALRATEPTATLSQAQLDVAREYGFASWRKLKERIELHRQKLDALVPADIKARAAADDVSPDDADLVALFAAIASGEPQKVADTLTRRPALASARGPDGQAPLHMAARYNDPQIATVLVAFGADLNATFGQSAHTPLSWAVTCNAPECGRALLRLGAEIDFFCAAGLGALDEVEECFDESGNLVAGASRTGSSRCAADGSRLPSPPATAQEQISDALYMACRNGHVDVVRFLLTKQPDLSFRAFLSGTPLHWAWFSGSSQVIDLLVAAGADREALDDELGCTPRAFGVAIAARWGFDFIVKRLLAADPALANAIDDHTSPLHEAARGGHVQTVRVLLDHGADPSFRNREGHTPREVAAAAGHTDVAEML